MFACLLAYVDHIHNIVTTLQKSMSQLNVKQMEGGHPRVDFFGRKALNPAALHRQTGMEDAHSQRLRMEPDEVRIGERGSAELALTAPFISCEGAFRHLILHVEPCPPPSTISKAAFPTATTL